MTNILRGAGKFLLIALLCGPIFLPMWGCIKLMENTYPYDMMSQREYLEFCAAFRGEPLWLNYFCIGTFYCALIGMFIIMLWETGKNDL